MAINVAAVVSQFGAYYLSNLGNMKSLRDTLYYKNETAQFFQDRPTDDTIWRGTMASLDRVVQPFQKAWTPIGTITFTPNNFSLFKLKIDKEETPDDIEPTYLGFLANILELDRAKWPFVKWLIENHVMPRKQQDLEVNEYFTGAYAAPTPGTAGAAGTAMNGLRTIIRAYNTGGLTNLGNGAIATGAPSSTNKTFVDQVEAFIDSIPTLFRNSVDKIFMSKTNMIKYRRGKRDKYNIYWDQSNGPLNIEDYPGIEIVGLQSMEGSNLIWTTTPENRIRPIKKAALADTMRVESLKRSVFMYTDWWEALNFEVPQFVFHNDQDLV